MSEQWTVEAIEKKRWLAQQHHGREGELAALDKIEELLELQGELTAALVRFQRDANLVPDQYRVLETAKEMAQKALAKSKGETNEPV